MKRTPSPNGMRVAFASNREVTIAVGQVGTSAKTSVQSWSILSVNEASVPDLRSPVGVSSKAI